MIWSMIWYRYELWYDIDMSIWYDIEVILYVYDMIRIWYEYMIWYEYDKIKRGPSKNYYYFILRGALSYLRYDILKLKNPVVILRLGSFIGFFLLCSFVIEFFHLTRLKKSDIIKNNGGGYGWFFLPPGYVKNT